VNGSDSEYRTKSIKLLEEITKKNRPHAQLTILGSLMRLLNILTELYLLKTRSPNESDARVEVKNVIVAAGFCIMNEGDGAEDGIADV